jgi:hypothetical protein
MIEHLWQWENRHLRKIDLLEDRPPDEMRPRKRPRA